MFRKIINKVLQLNIVSESTENDKYFLTIGMERQVRKTLMSDFKNDTRIIPFGKLTIYKANINNENYLEIGDVASGFLSDGVTFIPFGQYKGGDINDVNSWNVTNPLNFTSIPYIINYVTDNGDGTYNIDIWYDLNIFPEEDPHPAYFNFKLHYSVDGITYTEKLLHSYTLPNDLINLNYSGVKFFYLSSPDKNNSNIYKIE